METIFMNDEAELIAYYSRENIEDYPKKSNGKPDMRKSQNKRVLIQLKRSKILEKNKKENLSNFAENKDVNYRNEIINMNEHELDIFKKMCTDYCVICCESLKSNHCMLPCEHYFCVSCIAQHCRVNNNCPLCRKEICCKAKKLEKMDTYLLQGILEIEHNQNNIYTVLNDDINKYTWYQSFYNEINNFETYIDKYKYGKKPYNEEDFKSYKSEMLMKTFYNIYHLNMNISQKIVKYYDDQL